MVRPENSERATSFASVKRAKRGDRKSYGAEKTFHPTSDRTELDNMIKRPLALLSSDSTLLTPAGLTVLDRKGDGPSGEFGAGRPHRARQHDQADCQVARERCRPLRILRTDHHPFEMDPDVAAGRVGASDPLEIVCLFARAPLALLSSDFQRVTRAHTPGRNIWIHSYQDMVKYGLELLHKEIPSSWSNGGRASGPSGRDSALPEPFRHA
jgi:hypothetical protein